MKNAHAKTLAAVAALGLCLPAAASAQSAPDQDHFSHTLDRAQLATPRGAEAEQKRLQRKVKRFCDLNGSKGLKAVRDERACETKLMSEAETQIRDQLGTRSGGR